MTVGAVGRGKALLLIQKEGEVAFLEKTVARAIDTPAIEHPTKKLDRTLL